MEEEESRQKVAAAEGRYVSDEVFLCLFSDFRCLFTVPAYAYIPYYRPAQPAINWPIPAQLLGRCRA